MLFDHLSTGYSLNEFLEIVPSLDRVRTHTLIELAGEQIRECSSSISRATSDIAGAGSQAIGSGKIEL